jgi:hypothetical protein
MIRDLRHPIPVQTVRTLPMMSTMDVSASRKALVDSACLTCTAYTKGKPFPIYVSCRYCPPKDGNSAEGEWRINYDLYYVHDGALKAGHKHDWEGVTIVFKTDRDHP